MSSLRHPLVTFLSAASLFAAPIVLPAFFPAAAGALTAADTDKDGTISLDEAKAAAGAEFDKLDKDKDGSLTMKEAAHHVSKQNFTAANPDKDKTLTKDEYVGLATKLFKAADKDGDGTVDAKELHSTAGIELDRVIH